MPDKRELDEPPVKVESNGFSSHQWLMPSETHGLDLGYTDPRHKLCLDIGEKFQMFMIYQTEAFRRLLLDASVRRLGATYQQ